MMFSTVLPLSLTWCGLGYLFLGHGEPAAAILASMGAISTAWIDQRANASR